MSGIFSGLDASNGVGPFNTVTSSDQQDAAATGNDQGPTTHLPDQTPMSKIMAAVMRGAAKVQGQAQAKDVVSKQTNNADKVKLTMEPNPDDPGNPLLTIKNITAEQINGQEQANREQAYTQPQQQVERTIAAQSQRATPPASSTPPAPQLPQDIPLDHVTTAPKGDDPHPIEVAARLIDNSTGQHTPRPWEIDPEKLKSEDGIRSLIEMDGWGDASKAAHATWKDLQHGKTTIQAVARNIANKRLQNIHQQSLEIEATMAPAERQAVRAQAERDRQEGLAFAKAEEQRRLKTQGDAETKAANDEKLGFLKSNDLSLLDPDPAKMLAAVHAGTNATWTPQDDQRALIKRQQDVNAAFKDFTDTKKNTFSLGNYDSWEDAKGAFGFPLSPEQDKMGAGRWKADHTYVLREAALLRSTQEGRAARLEHLQYLNEHQGDVKPQPLDDSFVKGVSASDILSILPTVKNPDLVLQRKEALLRNEIQDRSEKLLKAQADERSVNGTPANQRKYGWETQLANYHIDAKTHADRITAAQSELQQIQAARVARKGGTVAPVVKPSPRPTNPTRGQTWQGPTGVQTFDGRGWVQ